MPMNILFSYARGRAVHATFADADRAEPATTETEGRIMPSDEPFPLPA